MAKSKASSSDIGVIKHGSISEFMRKRTQFVGEKSDQEVKLNYQG